ncbi:hypothetical protein [Bdellovibrio sp. HCB209]|uniref:hypothetical protein n=1 Tax=Bdellovibrio sp. HCB209 TaxID=3394354 RepID=UPI0039B46459
MKKGLIIIGLAIVAAFLFREGQREGVSNLAGNAIKASGDHAEKMANMDSPLPAQNSASNSTTSTSVTPEQPVPQMRSRDLPTPENRPKKEAGIVPPSPSELRSNVLFADTTWKVWTGTRAVMAKNFDESDADVLGMYGGFVVIRDAKMVGDERNFSNSQPMVVFDERMRTVGIVTGRVKVTLKSESTLPQVQKEYSLHVTDRFDHLKLYFVTADSEKFDLSKFVYVLKRDPRIANAELEIVSRNYVKN